MLNILLNRAELHANIYPLHMCANWTNVQRLVKRTEQHSTFRKTKEKLSRSTFVQWKVWSWSNFTEQDSTRVNKAQQGDQTLWTFCTQQMFSVVSEMFSTLDRGLRFWYIGISFWFTISRDIKSWIRKFDLNIFKKGRKTVSVSGQITEICLYGIVMYLRIKQSLFCSLFKNQNRNLKLLLFWRYRAF